MTTDQLIREAVAINASRAVYGTAEADLRFVADVLDANGSPLQARIVRHRAYIAHRAADAELTDPQPGPRP